MRNYIFILGIFLLWGCSPINKLYNNFSGFKEVKHYSDSYNPPLRLFFDRHGDLYPKQSLNSTEFLEAQSILQKYFIENKAYLKKAFEEESLQYVENNDVKLNFQILQDHIRDQYIQQINNLSNNKKLVFLIHGYNNTGESASLALEKLRVEVIKKFPHEKFQFVEVYWDGLTKRDNPLNSTTIWNNAQYSSSMAGLGLRKILINIKNKENYVITHSHGASVITEALFNVRRFDDKYYITNYNGKEIANLQAIYNTSTSKFSVGMLAPAIPGYNVFHEYYDRTVEGSSVVTTMTNYRFVNGFNKYDVATTKGFLAGSFGATTLACREDDHLAVQAFFKNDSKIYSRINFSEDKNNKQRSHAVVAYIENPNFNTFLISVIE